MRGVGNPVRPGLAGVVLGDLRAVTERLSCHRWGYVENELPQGRVAGAAQVDSDGAESVHEVAGVERLPGPVAGEEPGGIGVGGRGHVRSCPHVPQDEIRDGGGQRGRIVAEPDPGGFTGDDDVFDA